MSCAAPPLDLRADAIRSLVTVPDQRSPSTISQLVSGFDTTREYTLVYYWAMTDEQSIYDGFCGITTEANGAFLDLMETKPVTAYQYFEQKIVFTPSAADLNLTFTFACNGDYFYGAQFNVDDFTVVTSCPTCSLADTPPLDATCGAYGAAGNSSALIGSGDASSVANCAESCASTSGCLSFSFYGGASSGSASSCELYSGSVDELEVSFFPFGYPFYDIGCFQCAAQPSSTTASSTAQPTSTTTASSTSQLTSTTAAASPPLPTPTD